MALKAALDSLPEVMVISDAKSKAANCRIFDLKTTNILASFKEGNSAHKGLSFIGHDFVISAYNDKPLLKVWKLSTNNPDYGKMHVPGVVTSLAVSKCGTYCIASIRKTIYIWEVSSGNLKNTLNYHSQEITCLQFTSDGSHFISGGKDGMVLVWIVLEVLSSEEEMYESINPRFEWKDHSAEVTDIFVGNLGIFARVATASRDMTCKIYEIDSGNLLVSIRTMFEITAVIMDDAEYFLYLGSREGDIHRINLFAMADGVVNDYDVKEYDKCVFVGHSQEITAMSLSVMGRYLLSGSSDCSCRIWDTSNFTCTKLIPFDGPITNAFITIRPPGLSANEKYMPQKIINKFKLQDDEEEDMNIKVNSKKVSLFHSGCPDFFFDTNILNCSSESLKSLSKTKVNQKDLTLINTQLYSYALSETLSSVNGQLQYE